MATFDERMDTGWSLLIALLIIAMGLATVVGFGWLLNDRGVLVPLVGAIGGAVGLFLGACAIAYVLGYLWLDFTDDVKKWTGRGNE